jgi:hypothetical protein
MPLFMDVNRQVAHRRVKGLIADDLIPVGEDH